MHRFMPWAAAISSNIHDISANIVKLEKEIIERNDNEKREKAVMKLRKNTKRHLISCDIKMPIYKHHVGSQCKSCSSPAHRASLSLASWISSTVERLVDEIISLLGIKRTHNNCSIVKQLLHHTTIKASYLQAACISISKEQTHTLYTGSHWH